MANLEHLCCSDSDSDNGSTDGGKSTVNKTDDFSLQVTRENIGGDSKDASFFSNIVQPIAVLGTPPTLMPKKAPHDNCAQPSNFSVHSPSPSSALSSFSGFNVQQGVTFKPSVAADSSPLETSTFSFMAPQQEQQQQVSENPTNLLTDEEIDTIGQIDMLAFD